MTNSKKTEILDIEFSEKTPDIINKKDFYIGWPVVYILNNDEQMYIGETYHSPERMKQHLKNTIRRQLKEAHIIGSKDFTKSSTLDIESSLIELCSAMEEDNRVLQNGTNGIVRHNFANREEFAQDSRFFSELWKLLLERKLVKGSVENLKNQDLFKYSPYKSLNPEQCTTRDLIIENIRETFTSKTDRCMIVNGAAGTGKSILGIYLMKLLVTDAKYLTEDDESETLPFVKDLRAIRELKPNLKIAYVVSMTSFRNTLKEVFKHIKGLKANMVISPSQAVKKHYDILIVDEAHRLKQRVNLSSPGEYTGFDKNNELLGLKNGNQLDWIIKQSQIQILFYDDSQSIKPTDVPCEQFKALCKASDFFPLSSQMRCLAGRDYIDYVKRVLKQTQDRRIDFSRNYDLRLFYDIEEFCEEMLKKEKEFELSRIVSGYGYEWISKKGTKDKPNPRENEPDIQIKSHQFFWNKNDKRWPTSIKGNRIAEEVGCIHTIQGYDLNYCGVIFGPEILYRDGKIIIDRNMYFDHNGKSGVDDIDDLKNYIINIYSVLMTRGIRGTYVYVVDEGLSKYFKNFF